MLILLSVCPDNQNWCGAGKMLAIDAAGNFLTSSLFAPSNSGY